MYNKFIVATSIFVLFLCSCASQSQLSEIGTLKGVIGIYEGNCMPSYGKPPCEPRPIRTMVYITQLSKDFNSSLMVDSIQTNNDGEFQLKLNPGQYSLFIKDGEEVVCDGFECEKECFCTPFLIVADSVTNVSANVDHASW